MRNIKITESVTSRDEESVVRYMNEIRKYMPMDAQEEEELAYKMRAGDKKAFQEFVNRNLRFVISISKKYQHLGLPLADLIAEGNMGLVRAVERFDPTLGFKFSSFSVHYIRQAILDAITNNSDTVRLPSNRRRELNKVHNIIADFEKEHGYRPSDEEVARLAGISMEKLAFYGNVGRKTTSLDAPINDTEDYCMMDKMRADSGATDENVDKESMRSDLLLVLATLPEREYQILSMNFGLEGNYMYSLGEIATRMGISQERARQLKERGLKQLKENKKAVALLMKYVA